eukprot:scaffold47605_cov53-Phaeocystis_antarctica.AAC.2
MALCPSPNLCSSAAAARAALPARHGSGRSALRRLHRIGQALRGQGGGWRIHEKRRGRQRAGPTQALACRRGAAPWPHTPTSTPAQAPAPTPAPTLSPLARQHAPALPLGQSERYCAVHTPTAYRTPAAHPPHAAARVPHAHHTPTARVPHAPVSPHAACRTRARCCAVQPRRARACSPSAGL